MATPLFHSMEIVWNTTNFESELDVFIANIPDAFFDHARCQIEVQLHRPPTIDTDAKALLQHDYLYQTISDKLSTRANEINTSFDIYGGRFQTIHPTDPTRYEDGVPNDGRHVIEVALIGRG